MSYHIPGKSYWSKDIIFLVTDKDQLGMQAWLDAYHGISNSCKYPRTLHELKGIISWFSRKCRVEREKIIVGQKRLYQKEQEAVHTGYSICGVRFDWGFPAYPQRRFYFRGSENCISVRFKQSVSKIQLCIEVVFFFHQCLLYFLWYVCVYWRKVLRNKHHQFIPLWKKYFVWAPSSSVSAIWQFLPAAGVSGNSDQLLENVSWLCKGKYSTLASNALARLSSRHLIAHAPGSYYVE